MKIENQQEKLQSKIVSLNRIYLDNASTTKPDERVIEAMSRFQSENFGNPSSIHAFGKSAKVLVEDARDLIAEVIGASSSEIFFTSGGTEANNFAIKGIVNSSRSETKNHIVTSKSEHSAVLDTMTYLESKNICEVTYLAPDAGGAVDPDAVRSAIRDETFLIALMHSNNETGAITEIEEISRTANEKGLLFHCDTVQSFGKTPFNMKSLGTNTAIISSHKIYGPKGVAALYIKKGTDVEKFIHGGMQERDKRGGTENTTAIAGFRVALEIMKERITEDIAHYAVLRSDLISKLAKEFGDKIIFNSPKDPNTLLPNILNFSFDSNHINIDTEMLIIMLDLKGIAVSGGSACTSGTHKPSHVLLAMGRDERTALGAVRVSFGRENVIEHNDKLINALKEITDSN